MSEHVELQYLVELSTENTSTDQSVPNLLKNNRPIQKTYPFFGFMLAILSSLCFSLCSAIIKTLKNIDPIQLALFRFIGILLPALPVVIYAKESVFPKGKNLLLLVIRSIASTICIMCSFYAFRNMPLADASIIIFSVPTFVSLFAKLFLNEEYGFYSALCTTCSLLGVLVIIYPPIVGGPLVPVNAQKHLYPLACAAAFASTLFGASAYVLLRVLKGLHVSVIMTNFGAISTVQTFCYLYLFGSICIPSCGVERILVISLATLSGLGQALLTVSLQVEKAGTVAIARTADIVFAFLWQIFFFNEIPEFHSFLGACIVIIGILMVALRKWALALPPDSELRTRLRFLEE